MTRRNVSGLLLLTAASVLHLTFCTSDWSSSYPVPDPPDRVVFAFCYPELDQADKYNWVGIHARRGFDRWLSVLAGWIVPILAVSCLLIRSRAYRSLRARVPVTSWIIVSLPVLFVADSIHPSLHRATGGLVGLLLQIPPRLLLSFLPDPIFNWLIPFSVPAYVVSTVFWLEYLRSKP